MRPQHITAENAGVRSRDCCRRRRFNEAAAYHCGKPDSVAACGRGAAASMRPQHITAENMVSMVSHEEIVMLQ